MITIKNYYKTMTLDKSKYGGINNENGNKYLNRN